MTAHPDTATQLPEVADFLRLQHGHFIDGQPTDPVCVLPSYLNHGGN